MHVVFNNIVAYQGEVHVISNCDCHLGKRRTFSCHLGYAYPRPGGDIGT